MMDDYQPFLKELFKHNYIGSILEFGCGEGTKFLSDNSGRVRSVELACKQDHYDWFRKVEGYDLNNWDGTLYVVEDSFNMLMESFVEKELEYKYDLIFVDPGVHCRAEIVNLCFNKSDIIIAHDTNHGAYGWEKINHPNNYKKRIYKNGSGTTLWTNNQELCKTIDQTSQFLLDY